MKTINIIAVGKFKEKAYLSIEEEYTKRLRPFVNLKTTELKELVLAENSPHEVLLDKNDLKIIDILPKDSLTVLLDRQGKSMNSLEFSSFLERIMSLDRPISFVLGGSYGVGDRLKGESNHIISMSMMTFPHNLARILLLEQLYRGFMILKKHPYHK